MTDSFEELSNLLETDFDDSYDAAVSYLALLNRAPPGQHPKLFFQIITSHRMKGFKNFSHRSKQASEIAGEEELIKDYDALVFEWWQSVSQLNLTEEEASEAFCDEIFRLEGYERAIAFGILLHYLPYAHIVNAAPSLMKPNAVYDGIRNDPEFIGYLAQLKRIQDSAIIPLNAFRTHLAILDLFESIPNSTWKAVFLNELLSPNENKIESMRIEIELLKDQLRERREAFEKSDEFTPPDDPDFDDDFTSDE